ncbi:MAG: hypothetical protein JOZ62_14510, partial [Acidobacteriaceae bacterium]|nr:hypothetical protein [Acidobacteriaceae bacterium]
MELDPLRAHLYVFKWWPRGTEAAGTRGRIRRRYCSPPAETGGGQQAGEDDCSPPCTLGALFCKVQISLTVSIYKWQHHRALELKEALMATHASVSIQALHDRIRDGGFAVALSGGGHRAALATLGALIAIVDRGLGPKVIQIASVSGGSITNAFVAQRGNIEKLRPGELDEIATELATTIIRKGVLTKAWIALLVITPLVLGAAIGVVLRTLIFPWTWLAVLIGVGIALTALIARGLAVEWLLDRRYFRRSNSGENRRHQKRARLASLSGREIDHVFCMTDLVLGLPVYASSQHGGMVLRRLMPERMGVSDMLFHTFDASRVTLAELIRASAGFPGIPPRRLQIPPDPRIVAELPRVAFLADGGLWNNLGSQVLREDEFIGSHAAWENGVLRPYGPAPREMPLFIVNGSAPLQPTRTWAFRIPGMALLKSLLQVTEILNANTVLPRVESMRRAFDRRARTGLRPGYDDPADLVVDLWPIDSTAEHYRWGTLLEELIRETDPAVKHWEESVLKEVRNARKHAATSPGTDWLARLPPEPEGSFPVCGLANIDDWDALRRSPVWKRLAEEDGSGTVHARTTLGRVERGLARRLIARSYLNTYLVSLFLAPLADGELDRLTKLPERLDRIVGAEQTG